MKNVVLFSDDSELRAMIRQIEDYQVLYFSTDLIPNNLPSTIDLAIFDFDVVPLTLLDEWSQFPRLHIRKMAVVSAENVGIINAVLEQLDNYVVRPMLVRNLEFRMNQLSHDLLNVYSSYLSSELKRWIIPISGYAALLSHIYQTEENVSVEDTIEFVNNIHDSVVKLQKVIDFVVRSIRIGHIKCYRFEKVNVDKFIKLAEDIGKQKLKEDSQSLIICVPPSLPKLVCDEWKINFVFESILQNAYMYSDSATKIDLYVSIQDGYVLFGIQDYGSGIPENVVEHVFTQRHGYSLYLCKQIIEMHGGKIWFESELGVGTTFYFTLPLAE